MTAQARCATKKPVILLQSCFRWKRTLASCKKFHKRTIENFNHFILGQFEENFQVEKTFLWWTTRDWRARGATRLYFLLLPCQFWGLMRRKLDSNQSTD